jgi:hypothetical protein
MRERVVADSISWGRRSKEDEDTKPNEHFAVQYKPLIFNILF